MRSVARGRGVFSLCAPLVLAACVSGCAHRAVREPLEGHVPAVLAQVGSITLPEVHAAGGATPFRFQPPAGHVLVVYFGYTTCPDVCPTTLSDMHRAIARLGADAGRVELAFVTVDLARDSAAVLAPWLNAYIAGGHALRPENEAQLAVAERVFGASSTVTRETDGEIEVSHSGTGYLVDATGRVVDEWDFGSSPEVMAHDLRALLAGARL